MISSNDIEKGQAEVSALSAPASTPIRPSRIANPGCLGLFSFASTTFMLSMYNYQVRNITEPNVVVGMAIFCGGLAQFLAGMWEFPRGNMFGATAFSSYGAFWMSYATILIPSSGIIEAYATNPSQLENALGIYLVSWTMVTFFLMFATLRKNIAFTLLFLFLGITFAALASGAFNVSEKATKAGGILGVITAFIAYYIGLSELMAAEPYPAFRMPLGVIKND